MIVVFGLNNCDTCRTALKWLTTLGIPHEFTDFRSSGLAETQLQSWIDDVGWEKLLNRRSTSWRNLPKIHKQEMDETKAKALMLFQLTLIKRPVFETKSGIFVGFTELEMQLFREFT